MTTRRWIIIGLLAFLGSAIAFAPASLLRPFAARVPGLTVSNVSGSIWRGGATIALHGTPLGELRFALQPVDLLLLRLAYGIEVAGPMVALSGTAAARFDGYHLMTQGRADFALATELLARYDLVIPGRLDVTELDLAGHWRAPLPDARGEVHWSGGEVAYVLGGRSHRAALPALSGFIDSSSGYPQMTAYAVDDATPLLLAYVTGDGMASVGITKRFTQLVGQPWAGNEPDHAIVLEVAEKVF